MAIIFNVENLDQEKERKAKNLRSKWEYERKWHHWFAWRPVGIDNQDFEFLSTKKAWLCWVERKLEGVDADTQPEFYFWSIRRHVYRLPKG